MYFIFGYAETALTECVALVNATPVGLKAAAVPTVASSGSPASGVIFWNAYDEANGNYFTWSAQKQLVVVNGGAGSVTLTVKTKDTTLNGLAVTVADLVKVLAPGEIYFSGRLPSAFNDADKVKVTLADVSSGDSLGECFLAVMKVS